VKIEKEEFGTPKPPPKEGDEGWDSMSSFDSAKSKSDDSNSKSDASSGIS